MNECCWIDGHVAVMRARRKRKLAVACARAPAVADALLAISDERAARAKNQTVKKAYEKLRRKRKP